MKELEKILEEIKTEKKETLGPCRRKRQDYRMVL